MAAVEASIPVGETPDIRVVTAGAATVEDGDTPGAVDDGAVDDGAVDDGAVNAVGAGTSTPARP